MSVTSAMYTGVSGLLGNSEAMNVIGNNISNVNTVGFKTGRSLFSDMLSDSMGNFQVGTGTKLQSARDMFTQGSVQQSGSVTDLCISGDSFFALKGEQNASPATQDAAYLTRAGAFHVDGTLTLVNPEGYQVLDTAGNPIRFTDSYADSLAGFATSYGGGTLPTQLTADLAAVSATGAANAALLTAATDANAAVTSAASAYAASPNASAAGTLAASISAAYAAIVAANGSVPPASQVTLTAGAAAVTALSTAAATVQDSWKSSFGTISKIGADGLITYVGKDGITENYYSTSGAAGVAATPANAAAAQKVALVRAVDPTALQKVGGSLYKAVPAAGVANQAFSLTANTGNGSSEKIVANSLESSNTDMAQEFVSMIVTQRAYSACSKTITTSDQMTQEVLALIR